MPIEKKELVWPIVNINGTSRDELLKQCMEAHEAILAAIKAMRDFAPHGRDYQTYENSAEMFRKAQQQHIVWLSQLDDMRDSLEQIGCAFL